MASATRAQQVGVLVLLTVAVLYTVWKLVFAAS
jgi:hypothetical protein